MAMSAIIDVTTAGLVAPDEVIVFQILAFGPRPPVSGESRMPERIPESPDPDDVEDVGEASCCNVVGMAETSCESWLCVLVPAAWPDAAPWASRPPGLVVFCGALNGVTFDAAAELAA